MSFIIAIELKASTGAKSLYKTKSNATTLALPKNIKLLPDAEYNWMVKAAGIEVGMTNFKTLPAHSLDLTQKRKPDDKAPFSDWLLYALTLKDVGADQDAGEIWTKLAKDRPPRYGVRNQSARAGAARLPRNSTVSAVLSSSFMPFFIRNTPGGLAANAGPPPSCGAITVGCRRPWSGA